METQLAIVKPIMYLDQNVLDLFVKGKYTSLHDQLRDEFQVIYSDETLCEIKRSGTGASGFISILHSLNAYHIGIELSQPNFALTGRALIKNIDPTIAYQEYLASNKSGEDVSAALYNFLFKFQGGNENQTFTEMFDDSKHAFIQHLKDLNFAAQQIGAVDLSGQRMKTALSQFTESIDFIEKSSGQEYGDGIGWSGVQNLRTASGLGPSQLNNIEGPDTIQEIWQHLWKTEPYFAIESIDEFLNLTPAQNGNRELYMFEKIQAIYNTLNTVGYHPDTEQNKPRGFVRALSDTGHASIAWFCHFVLSRDERFVKKLRAAIEYLGCKNQIILMKES